jgi:NADH-quinone oxidoreductase subunit L
MDAITLIPLALLAGAALNGLLSLLSVRGRRILEPLVALIAIAAPVSALAAALHVFGDVSHLPSGRIEVELFDWIAAGSVNIDMKLVADNLTCVMLLVITGIGSLIHIYATAYMHGDEAYPRFFACLNLFTFFMTMLVLGSSLPVLFLGWEGVGLCSYLLIGFWWKDAKNSAAGMKAFVVNRIGDAGFLLGMFLLWQTAGTLEFDGLRRFAEGAGAAAAFGADSGVFGASVATLACLLLFVGATGKSAQIPLFVWLPDAMAGPTPVSALIHAATMVTAGVYLVARLAFLFSFSATALATVMVIGGATCFFAGLMAVRQNDIKKVLAYSTISQIGYMMIGVGTGWPNVGMFHVVTHAFFKAALFLGAGSVIHACHHEQDMRHMGGLIKKMPLTAIAMTLAAAAMAGVPPLAGFFSKDEVLWRAFATGTDAGMFAWVCGMLGAACTGFYMFRLIFMTFGGSYRGHAHPHEVPGRMWATQGLLALGSVGIGFLAVPHILGGHDLFGSYVNQVLPLWAQPAPAHGEAATEWLLMGTSTALGLLGIAAAWLCYIRNPRLPDACARTFPRTAKVLEGKFFVDEAYDAGVVRPLEKASQGFFHKLLDRGLIDGLVNGTAALAQGMGSVLRHGQTGLVRTGIGLMLAAVAALLLLLLG